MRKTLLAKNVLLLFSMPLISSACYVPNILENNANKPVWKDFSNKNHNDVLPQWNKVFVDSPTGHDISKIELDKWEKNRLKNSRGFLASAKMTGELFSDEFLDYEINIIKNEIDSRIHNQEHSIASAENTARMFDDAYTDSTKKAVERYKKHTDKHLSESAKHFAELFSDEHKAWVDKVKSNIKAKIYRDSTSGLDIEFYPTDKQIDDENKRLEKEVNKILRKNWDLNKAQLDSISAAKEVELLFSNSKDELIKKAEEAYAKELVDKDIKHIDNKVSASNSTKDLFSNDYLREIEKAKRNKEIGSKIYNDSSSGLDINIHWTNDDLERVVNKILKDNKELNKTKWSEFKTANDIAKIFDDTYTDLIKLAIGREKQRKEKEFLEYKIVSSRDFEWIFTEPEWNKYLLPVLETYSNNNNLFVIDKLSSFEKVRLKKLFDSSLKYTGGIIPVINGELFFANKYRTDWYIKPKASLVKFAKLKINKNLSPFYKLINTRNEDNTLASLGHINQDTKLGIKVTKTDNIYKLEWKLALRNGELDSKTYTFEIDFRKL
ncbi:MAG6090-like repeat-containing lipoprotein [Mycoplasmopsis agalactiae]|uniref:MAG6090-like repeat-containing lipoprotein n=1 Tax=Mycoplasmopsis agalactiae TaxID=2110 RepID=UPI001F926249|nr:hypothetical protein [Mycoplasmopsis agalactiae]